MLAIYVKLFLNSKMIEVGFPQSSYSYVLRAHHVNRTFDKHAISWQKKPTSFEISRAIGLPR